MVVMIGGGGGATVVVGTTAVGRATVVVAAVARGGGTIGDAVSTEVEGKTIAVVDDGTTRVVEVDTVLAGSDSPKTAPITESPHNPRTPIPTTHGHRRFLSRCLGGRAHGSGG
ncbi:hypothetical protein [Nocardia coubleae]|uniref:hypothetical protein n=1 Tax=Nocardia coubleae TaxID=356147 RepID=UPI00082E77B3|nr:hypothetical protein [Nocardia coubleae]